MRPRLIAAAGLALTAFSVPAPAADLTLRRVVLSSGGVGEFTFTAEMDGPDVLPLSVPLSQVDDLLKSLRIADPAGGLPSVSLPGRQPLAEAFRTLPFSQEALASPEALLGALVGEEVRVPSAGIAGRVLSVTEFEVALPDQQGKITRHRLGIATGQGVDSVVLEDAHDVEFVSAELRAAVETALGAFAAHRAQDRRTLSVSLPGSGRRTVEAAYVIPVPVWKATYRLTAAREGDSAQLQAYAVVENLSGRDWTDVGLTLTSGQPVLYHQPLYEALFATRPEAPVEVASRLTPKLDEGAIPRAKAEAAPPPPASAPAPAQAFRMQAAPAAEVAAGAGVGVARPEAPPAAAAQSLTQVSFHLARPVSAPSGDSLLLPVIDRKVPARRIDLYQPETDRLHPLVAVELTNDTGAALPPGLVTLYEETNDAPAAFVGDARLPAIQPGEKRMASFALDLATRVDFDQGSDSVVVGGRAARGVLTIERRDRNVATYRVAAPPGSARRLVIEQPRRPGWTLAEPAQGEETPTAWRIMRDLPAGSVETIRVVTERPRGETIALIDQDVTRLLAFAQQGTLPEALRKALSRAAELRAELDRRQQALKALREKEQAIVNDQARLRSNLSSVPGNSDLQRRYLNELRQQEDDLANLRQQQASADQEAKRADAALRDFVANLSL